MKSIALIVSFVAALSLTACSSEKSETTQKGVEVAASHTPEFDISGLKIGMTQSEVESVTAQNGYDPKNRSGSASNIFPGLSFAQLVKKRQGEFVSMHPSKHDGVGTMSYQKEGREFIDVTFTAFQSGPKVTTVNYRLMDTNMSQDQFKERVIAKYGEPNGEAGLNGPTWQGAQNYKIDGIPVKENMKITFVRGAENLSLAGNSLGLQGSVNQQAYVAALDEAIPKSKGDTGF